MAKCDFQFLLFAAAIVCAAAATAAAAAEAANVVEACTKAVKEDELLNYCVQVFLKDKAGELTNAKDWEKMSRVVISHGASNAAAIEKWVGELANNQSLSMYERATLNLCHQSLKTGADQIAQAAAAYEKMDKVSVQGLEDVKILVDDGKTNQGKCDEMLDSQEGLNNVWKEVHDAYSATRIVTGFLDNVRLN